MPVGCVQRRCKMVARISTHLARSSGSHTNSDTPVGMPFSSV